MILGFSNILRNSTPFYYVDLPSFQRDFASLKTLDHGTGPNITFTRASNATYFDANGVLQTASNDVPRFDHDPADGGKSLGLLIEEARTNLLERSAEFDNAYWTKSNATVTANAIAAPDGTTTADLLVENTAASTHFARRIVTIAATTAYSLSVFAKSAGRSWLALTWNGASGFYFDLQNGTVGSSFSGADASVSNAAITSIGNGWYRCSLTLTSTDTTGGLDVFIGSANGTSNYTGDGTSGLYIWGAQLEAGAFPTSYIPTTTAAATRSADSAVVTPISSFYNQSEGTLFAEYRGAEASAGRGIVEVNVNSVTDRFAITTATTTAVPSGSVRIASVNEANIPIGSSPLQSDVVKFIMAAAQDNFQAARGGTLGTADTSGNMPTNLTHLRIGATGSASSAHVNGHIRKIAYYPKRLSNTLLQQLTT